MVWKNLLWWKTATFKFTIVAENKNLTHFIVVSLSGELATHGGVFLVGLMYREAQESGGGSRNVQL